MWLIAAAAWAVVIYLWTTRDLLPTRWPKDSDRRVRRTRKTIKESSWSVTARAIRLLGWTPERFRRWSVATALLVGIFWMLLVQNVLAGALMGYLGWQLPAWWLESRAMRGLSDLHRQFAEWVSLIHDQLHSRGSTVDTALAATATSFTTGPLAPVMAEYLRATGSGMPLRDRLAMVRHAIDLPTADFFFQLLLLRDQSGSEDMAHAFDSLDEKLQDDEQVQALIQSEVRMHSLFLVGGFFANLVVYPLYRVTGADWPAIHAHLNVLVTGSALLTVMIFASIRRFIQAQMAVGNAL